MLDMEKAQRMSLTMQVEVRLKNALIMGSLKPGARLVTKEIADQLGTSITPVREALLRLVSSGALDATPAQAFLVPELTLERFNEITVIRKNLESQAVEVATQRCTPEQLAGLRQRFELFRAAKISGSVEEALQANRAFRFELYACADMPTLMGLIEQMWIRIGPSFNYLYPQSNEMIHGHHNYEDLLDALERKDAATSIRAIHKSIDDGALILIRQHFSAE
ncbi:GntR family transcriptional regulator [Siccibacter colletis]|uniref:GntR family transcriptional regulator n=1 Tax=Siccibacter colletis TaxID=1505757 RepID=UPI0004E25A3B|nr:GntR family transcriptional regulator [Siccibacter colletis]